MHICVCVCVCACTYAPTCACMRVCGLASMSMCVRSCVPTWGRPALQLSVRAHFGTTGTILLSLLKVFISFFRRIMFNNSHI